MIQDQMRDHLVNRYNEIIATPELQNFYEGSYFLNFGYWYKHTVSQKEACENLMEELLARIADNRGTILDIACGQGGTSAYLQKYYAPESITAINISSQQLQIARTLAPRIAFRRMNATQLAFEDNFFDNAICVEAAFHFYTRQEFLEEAHRVLKPNGRVVLSDILMTLDAERWRTGRSEKNYLPNLDAYRTLLHRAGFDDIDICDATEACWHGQYWYAVKYFHHLFLSGRLSREELEAFLYRTYLRVFDIRYYVLVAATKPSAGSRAGASRKQGNNHTH